MTQDLAPTLGISYASTLLFSAPWIAVASTYIVLLAAVMPIMGAINDKIDKDAARENQQRKMWIERIKSEVKEIPKEKKRSD